MIQSNYKIKSLEDPLLDVKKKLLAKPKIDSEMPTTEEIDYDLLGTRPARTKKEMDTFSDNQDKKDGQIYGGIYNTTKAAPAKEIIDGVAKEDSWMDRNGGAIVAGATGVMDMAATVASQKGPMDKQERKANTINMASKGASTGAAVGSVIPGVGTLIGAAAGGIIGAGTGLIQGIGDQKELDMKAKMERVTNMNNIKDEREKAQRLAEGKDAIEKKKNVLKSQMGTIGANYTQTKIS